MIKKTRRPITLLEIMIVILLIGLIGGVVSYNLKGTLERGKKFRTEEGIRRLQDILSLEIQQGTYTVDEFTGQDGAAKVAECVRLSGFIPDKEVERFLQDGWSEPYHFSKSRDGEIVISSHRLQRYHSTHSPK